MLRYEKKNCFPICILVAYVTSRFISIEDCSEKYGENSTFQFKTELEGDFGCVHVYI